MSNSELNTAIDEIVTEDVSAAALLELLSDRRRRHLLDVLYGRNEPLTLSDLAGEIAARETDTAVTDEERRRIRISLYHIHAPKLAAADLLEFDWTNETVAPIETGHPVYPSLKPLLALQ